MLDFLSTVGLSLSSSNIEIRFLVDLIAAAILVFVIYYRRHNNKELVTSAMLFNIFVFAILSVLSSVNFGISAGFGLFAILALFTLRSEPFGRIDITYFFGSISIAVICAVQGTSIATTLLAVLFIVIGAYIVDHPQILKSNSSARVQLDYIDPNLFVNPAEMIRKLSALLKVDVLSFSVKQIDYLTEKVTVDVYFRKHLH